VSQNEFFFKLDELICKPIGHAESWNFNQLMIANSFKTFLLFGT